MKSINFFLFLLVSGFSFSQYDGKDPKIASRYRPGIMWFSTGWRPANIEKPRKYDRLMVDLSTSRWLCKDSTVNTNFTGSISCSINGMWDIPFNAGNGVALGIGFAYRIQRIGFDGTILRDTLNNATNWNPKLETIGVQKSVYSSHQIAVPLELRLRMKKWRHAKLHLGGYLGYAINSETKQISNNRQLVIKDAFFFDSNPIVYGIHARLGIRSLAFFGSYELSKPFKNSKSTQLNTLQIGITISLF